MINNYMHLDPQSKQNEVTVILKKKRRRFVRGKSLKKQPLKEIEAVSENIMHLHQRQKIKTKRLLANIFETNISMFCRLNAQKSTYEKLFSHKDKKGKEVKQLKRSTSTKMRVHSQASFLEKYHHKSLCQQKIRKLKRPQSCKLTTHSSNLLTLQTIQTQVRELP